MSPPLIPSPPPPSWGFRVRLSEGFHFACSGEGIINMVLELPVQVRELESLMTSPCQRLSAQGHLPLSWVGTAVNSASWGPCDQRTQNLRPVPGQCGGGWGLRARAGLAEIYPGSPVLAPRTSPWGRLQAKRSTPASSSTSSSPLTLPPPKTGETHVLSGSGVSPHSHLSLLALEFCLTGC